jgi:hypothetical protein
MSQVFKFPVWAAACAACLGVGAAAQTASNGCDQAWANYNEFTQHNVMEPSQYALTVHGAAVRAACGAQALPVPPGTDTPPLPILHKKTKPVKPPEKPKPPKPPTP